MATKKSKPKPKPKPAVSAAATALTMSRWNSPEWQDPKKRRAFGTMISRLGNGKRTGRPRQKHGRCPCGEMTAKRAKARGHRCKKAA